MIKRVYKCTDGTTYPDFETAKRKELDLADNWIGSIMDAAKLQSNLSHNPIQATNQVHNFMTENCDELINALLNWRDAKTSSRSDFEDET